MTRIEKPISPKADGTASSSFFVALQETRIQLISNKFFKEESR